MNVWRVALIDSCGALPEAVDAAAFVSDGRQVLRRAPGADPSGHGTRLAAVIGRGRRVDWLLGQVFTAPGPTSCAVVAAAIDWAVAGRAHLIHLSLGVPDDRRVLAAAVERAVRAGCVIVAATPARGAAVYPAAYPGVIRASGDARCGAGEWSVLAPAFFGACPRLEPDGVAPGGAPPPGGASVGAAWVTHAILGEPPGVAAPGAAAAAVIAALTASARYRGAERRGANQNL